MFKRSFSSKDRVNKPAKLSKRSFGGHAKQKLLEKLETPSPGGQPHLTSAIITLVVGKEQRLFACHEDLLAQSPFFQKAIKERLFSGFPEARINLTDEEPETFSCVLEYLYKGDYSPRLLHDKRRNAWYLEGAQDPILLQKNGGRGSNVEPTMYHSDVGDYILRDTAVYCAAERFGLEELKRLSLRKQGLQTGIEVATILRSARYAYGNTPDTDSRLRAHYLALIIRSRKTFKRSGTMQMEMEMGGKLFFDLFVAMANHLDDLQEAPKGTPRTI